MIYFEIGGRKVQPNKVQDALEKAVLRSIEAQVRQKVGAIRDPQTGEFPTIACKGSSIDNLKLSVEGSAEMIALVKERLGVDEDIGIASATKPIAFLSYAIEDTDLARRIAEYLQENGVDTWWADWCISSGDSLRQKIEEGLGNCTHFIVLLTPTSIKKPWVNTEIDAGFVRKLSKKCKFMAVRHELPSSELSPLLEGLHAPEIVDFDIDVKRLLDDIYGVSRKPPLGKPPAHVQEAQALDSGYSAAAMAIAKIFVEKSKHGSCVDPQFSQKDLQELVGLSDDDFDDGLHELSEYLNSEFGRVYPKKEFYTEFDKFWKPWNPYEDALKLAADMVNDKNFAKNLPEIAALYGWDARRMNPALNYLIARELVLYRNVMGCSPWITPSVEATSDTRRFVKSRS